MTYYDWPKGKPFIGASTTVTRVMDHLKERGNLGIREAHASISECPQHNGRILVDHVAARLERLYGRRLAREIIDTL